MSGVKRRACETRLAVFHSAGVSHHSCPKGVSMDRNNVPKGREKNVSGKSADVHRKGQGLGTGPVGNSGGFGGAGGKRPTGGMNLGSLGNSLNNMMPGQLRSRGKGGCGCLVVVLVAVVLLFGTVLRSCSRMGGGFSLFDLLFGGGGQSYEEAYQYPVGTQPATQPATVPQIPWHEEPESQYVPSVAEPQTESQKPSVSYGSPAISYTSNNNGVLDETTMDGIRDRYTKYSKKKSENTATVMVYMCGSDLESRSGMGTSDLQEMIKSGLGENVNLLVYTGGAKKWQNSVMSASNNQLYQVKTEGGQTGLERLIDSDGNKAMSDPATLTGFIKYCAKNFPSNRNILILWDHGAGTVSGYAYDEKHPQNGYMSLSGINKALKDAKVKFDFIGFDACLMATLENGLMLNEYADYLIASEETEPGTGWYYTNWLKLLSQDPAVSTVKLGKQIADDFTDASQKYARGSDTTLSVIDLAELAKTVPAKFIDFAVSTNELIGSDNYKSVSTARGNTKEFASSEKIDQIDLVNFAENLGTEAGNDLASAIQSAVKYNRTSRGYEKAYGLSVYFPYRRVKDVDTAARLYDSIGVADEYADCIKAFANLELTGQVSAGGSGASYGSLFDMLGGSYGSGYGGYSGQQGGSSMDLSSLFGGVAAQGAQGGYSGGYGSYSDYYGSGYGSSGSLDTEMIGSLLGMFLGGRSSVAGLSAENTKFVDPEAMQKAASYVAENSINVSHLAWAQSGTSKVLAFDDADWEAVDHLLLNVFVDDGEGFIDLGLDNVYEFDDNANLIGDYDGTWLSVNGQIVAYYFLDEAEGEDGSYLIRGYIPALVNGVRAEIYVAFDNENPNGYVTGYKYVYLDGTDGNGQVAKVLSLTEGDTIEYIADYYTYDLEYADSYRISDPVTYDGTFIIENTGINGNVSASYRITDIYNQNYWTPQM